MERRPSTEAVGIHDAVVLATEDDVLRACADWHLGRFPSVSSLRVGVGAAGYSLTDCGSVMYVSPEAAAEVPA